MNECQLGEKGKIKSHRHYMYPARLSTAIQTLSTVAQSLSTTIITMSPLPSDTQNPCVLLHGPEHTSISTTYLSVPALSDYPSDYVLLRIAFVGVCGSDVHFYMHGGVGSDRRKYAQWFVAQGQHGVGHGDGGVKRRNEFEGLVMGHEASATVLEVGGGVKRLKVDDRVAIEPGVPCRSCARCVEGLYNLCFGMRFAASFYESVGEGGSGEGVMRATPGTLCRYFVLPESLCYKLPGRVGLEEGVLVEPLAVGVHAVRLAGVSAVNGHRVVVVCGAGTIGLVGAALSCAFGAAKVVLVDVNGKRLEFTKRWLCGEGGAARTAGAEVLTFESDVGVDAVENARRLKVQCELDVGADIVLEASGVSSATALGVYVLRTGGHMVQTGLSKKPLMNDFPIVELSEKETHLHRAFRYKEGDFEVARDLMGRGVVGSMKELINEVFDFERYEDAWKATRAGKGIKNMIRVQD